MDYLIDLVFTHGPYVAICLVITFVLTAAKRSFPVVFNSEWGTRALYFAPAILGALMGWLFLTELSLKLSLLYGMACGTVSQTVYSIVTKVLRKSSGLDSRVVSDEDYDGSVVEDQDD